MKSIRLILADDHTLVRAGMRTLLKGLSASKGPRAGHSPE